MPKISKEIISKIITGIAILIFIGILVWAYLQKKEALAPEEVVEEEVTIDEFLEQVDPAEIRLMTEQEQQEIDELLEQVDPAEIRPMTEQEQQEIEDLLKQLTP